MTLTATDCSSSFRQPDGSTLTVLDDVNLEVEPGTRFGISGPSGSGKTTLLYVLSGILRPQRGVVRWGADELTRMGEAARDRWRLAYAGFVFQDFLLFPGMSPIGNVALPASFGAADRAGSRGRIHAQRERPRDRAAALLERVGITDRGRAVSSMSRGERQRVAIARALLSRPAVIFADEPTASLDRSSAADVGRLLVGVANEAGATLIVVTHDPDLLAQMDRVAAIEAGSLRDTVARPTGEGADR
ncbi:MAG: ATP-binding cassette domain-containing protein [Spirochaetaceae bacterium]|nr:MAG: ATP-binding cassette domain-containing protein [Spirochaetaceae bacterium]